MNVSSFKDLRVWTLSVKLGLKLYNKINDFPKYEQFALCDQMRRCIISIPSNIAEGHSRNSNKEFIHFLSISRGSIAELQTQIYFAIELNYIDKNFGEEIIYEYDGIDVMIKNLMKTIKSKNPNILKTMSSFIINLFI